MLVAPTYPRSHQSQCHHPVTGTRVMLSSPLYSRPSFLLPLGRGRKPEYAWLLPVDTQVGLLRPRGVLPFLLALNVFVRLCQCFLWVVSRSPCHLHDLTEERTKVKVKVTQLGSSRARFPQALQLPSTSMDSPFPALEKLLLWLHFVLLISPSFYYSESHC